MKTKVVHCKRAPYDVYIGRPSKWGNPFPLEDESERLEVIEKYRAWILKQPKLMAVMLEELEGKVLGCWCSPRPCHGQVLVDIVKGQRFMVDQWGDNILDEYRREANEDS